MLGEYASLIEGCFFIYISEGFLKNDFKQGA
jgi:hypothetical protein